ncbi:MAG: hypothetical protein ACKVZH_11430 [Blastocatellia bacterium]
MHNFDRTTMETGYEFENYEFENDEYEYEYEDEGEAYGEMHGEAYAESPFSEAEEMELAAELLSVNNEAELEQFLGKLFKRAGRAIGKFVKSPIGQQLGGILKGAAKQALPMLGGALGNLVLPGVGGALGSQLASGAGSMLGLELEGLSQEDQEFELARQFVRFAGAAAGNAAEVSPVTPPAQAAQQAAVSAAQTHAPGLLKPSGAPNATRPGAYGQKCQHRKKGMWVRNGNNIIIIGA